MFLELESFAESLGSGTFCKLYPAKCGFLVVD